MTVMEMAGDDQQRNERIAKQMSRSQFMGLGENPPKLASESSHSLMKTNWATFKDKNSDYIKDESVPPQIYTLVEQYRIKARHQKPGNDFALLIDDFFGEANVILKDAQLREIARIRNENNVEVTKLKRIIENFKVPGSAPHVTGKENRSGAKGGMFVDNEVARERMQLI